MLQHEMESTLRTYLNSLCQNESDRLSGKLGLALQSCNAEAGVLEVSFLSAHWMGNALGSVHGGILASVMDVAMGALCRCISNGTAPTVHLEMNYHFPVPLKHILVIRAAIEDVSPPLYTVSASLFVSGKDHRKLVTAKGCFYHRDSRQR